jgi:hypothetical protein
MEKNSPKKEKDKGEKKRRYHLKEIKYTGCTLNVSGY